MPRLTIALVTLAMLIVVPSTGRLQGAAPSPIRIAVDQDVSAAMRRGVEFGLKESVRTARLVGRTVVLAPTATSATAVITARGLALPHCSFAIVLDDAKRAEARTRWASQHGDGPVEIVEWHPSLSKYGASEVNERFVAATGSPMNAEAWSGWFAVKAVVDTSLRAGTLTCEALRAARLDGHKGRPLTFAADGSLVQPLYVVSGDTVVGEIS